MSKITRIKLENFTAFSSLDVEFSKGVNIIIGANGTGKTHLLKVLYAACAVTMGEDKEKGFARKLLGVFNPYQQRMTRLIRRQQGLLPANIAIRRDNGNSLKAVIDTRKADVTNVHVTGEGKWQTSGLESAYIPVKEMLAHAPGFLSTVAKREIAFEEVYVDIIKRAFLPTLRGPTDRDRKRLLNVLQTAIEGKVITKGEYFFLKNKQGDLEFTLLAEGMRKLALVWLLIQNGTLLAGSVLFWDEPEANLNPSLMGEVVEVILELQRLGVQIFLTTHNYVLLKEFDLRKKKDDAVRYLSLFRDEDEPDAVSAHVCDDYLGIDPNAIAATFNNLYDGELMRSLGGIKA
ncbi:AAA family ATPase [Candidatus Methylospira mobilis]|uniref:AAA family ATPase n=1 Tax=Candidatus Methylospira mobilis TaxID=1808979 RepID=A0A5Q0BQ88_9GAMM|nr:ATP-binding protein [Candidatus Methylospira mobilis]QFY44247.1 AAA family ATPase [Candidatus Methylospira mobilis]